MIPAPANLGPGVALAYGLLSLTAFGLHGWDKWSARRAGRRVPERSLHLVALLGGFVGAWIGMRVFRHKTRKPVFAVIVFLAALGHGGFWSWRVFG